jgi:hypothetical protein
MRVLDLVAGVDHIPSFASPYHFPYSSWLTITGVLRPSHPLGDEQRWAHARRERQAGGTGWVTPRALMRLLSPCYHWRNSPTVLRPPAGGIYPARKVRFR